MRAFTSQKGPGKGLPASGFAPANEHSTRLSSAACTGVLIRRVSPNQSNAAPLIGARAKNLQAASARHRSPGAARRRRQRQAHVPLPTSTSSPTQSTPGLSAQFLRTHHRRVRRGSSSYAAGFSGIRRAPLASAATHAFVAAAAGQRDDGARCRSDRRFDGFDVVVLRRGRRRSAEL